MIIKIKYELKAYLACPICIESYTVGPHTYHVNNLLHCNGSLDLLFKLYTSTFDLLEQNERFNIKFFKTLRLRMIKYYFKMNQKLKKLR